MDTTYREIKAAQEYLYAQRALISKQYIANRFGISVRGLNRGIIVTKVMRALES